jgi:Phosphodiester glycosidase
MSVLQRLALSLVIGLSCLLATSSPLSVQQNSALSSTAHAQGGTPSGRIDFYLPPARVAPPVPIPAPRRRPAQAVPARSDGPQWKWSGFGIPAGPGEGARPHHTPRPGLFTVSRIGRRLFYRKGYLDDVPIHLVVADLTDPEIKIGVMVARGGVGTTESLAGMVQRAQPAAALTGTFFGLDNALPTGDLVVNGRAIYQGFVGTALAFTEGNVVSFIPTGYKEKTAWRFFDGVLRAGPLLVQEGRIAVGPHEEGFVSLSAAARRSRTAVGITSGRKLLLMAVKEPISLWQLAKLMRRVGAYHAVAMDGGTSTGLYFRGQMVARPGRALTNALVVYAYQQHYQQAKSSFLPGYRPRPAERPAPPSPLRIHVEPAPDVASPSPNLPDPAQAADAPAAEISGEPTPAASPDRTRQPSRPPAAPAPTVEGGTAAPSDGATSPPADTGAG